MTQLPVLIVGAGPTGLMLACQLARHSSDFRIVDPKPGPTVQSRAMVVQARSLEVYEQLGLSDECAQRSQRMLGMSVFIDGKSRLKLDLGNVGEGHTRFAEVGVLEQSENERILVSALNALGCTVEWGTKFEHMDQNEDKCIVTLRNDSSDESETCDFSWVVGCDGARSPLRHALDLPFSGGTYNATFYVADVDLQPGQLERDYGSLFVADAGFGLAFPMRGGNGSRFRLIGAVPSEAAEQPGWMDNPEFSVVADAFRQLSQLPLEFDTPSWFATYAVHHRKVSTFRKGRALLAGDAAHVHSPAGGQGMNTGLLDAHNLGWKLALVTRGVARPELLDSYNSERETFARQLLNTTDNAFKIMTSANPVLAALRKFVLPVVFPLVLGIPGVPHSMFRRISQIAIAYRDSSLSRPRTNVGALRPGDRFPYCKVLVDNNPAECVDAAVLLRDPGFAILDFSGSRGVDAAQIVKDVATLVDAPMHYHSCKLPDDVTNDGGVADIVYVVRPDMYVGLVVDKLSKESLVEYLADCVHVHV